MAVTSDGKTLVVCSRLNNALYAYSLPDLKVIGAVTNDVSVIDISSMKEVTRIAVGYVPKRNTTGILQQKAIRNWNP
jgi:hypothetical protein